jgi:peptidoglycan/xylan/chitin deacetylase (PgdA/CDA1 family)
MERRGVDRIPYINFWPDGKRFAFVLTHDVEGPAGLANIERVLDVERRHGLVSAWFFVAEDYEIPPGTFELIRAAGGEVALHGLTHNGSLFHDRHSFESGLPRIHRYLSEWDAVGFRSPSTHRNAEWMPELGCLYDSSFPDTDPFEPQPGGCCSILPFFLRDLVELPMTLLQDHTLFEILEQRTADLWISKAEWVVANRGLVNVLVHPDYADPHRLDVYARLLAHLKSQSDGWHALPREVASWWRVRATLERELAGRIPSDLPDPATLAHALLVEDRIEIEA